MKKIDILDLEVSRLEQKYNILVSKIKHLHVQYVYVLVRNRTCTIVRTIVKSMVRTRFGVPDTSLEIFMIPWKKRAPSYLWEN
jgi:hypothetical protein